MSLESSPNSGFSDPPFRPESATVSSFSACFSMKVTSVLSALTLGLSMVPGAVLAAESEAPFEVEESAASAHFGSKLALHLSVEESSIGAVVLCDDVATGPWGGALDAKNFLTYQVHKVDFPGSDQVTFYVRFLGGRYFFAENPTSLFQEEENYQEDPAVMDKAGLLLQLTQGR